MNPWVAFLILGSVFAAPKISSAQEFTLTCLNPKINLKFTDKGINKGGQGEASSQPVQFNINIPGKGGAIFVNEKNNGICEATISAGYRLLSGRHSFRPTGSWTGNGEPPNAINKIVRVNFRKLGTREGVFEVSRTSNDLSGNVTLVFFVEYEEAK
jgi:hypothetical protein